MKRLLYCIVSLVVAFTVGCSEVYDDSQLKSELDDLRERLEEVETLLNASAGNLSVTSVVESAEGYVVTFSDGSSITIKHGRDGADGKDGQDGAQGDKGEQGEKGEQGDKGEKGEDGADGKDGVDGETLIDSIIVGESDVTFILTSGKTVVIPLEGYYDTSEAPINFLDNTTKVLCVLAWDTDGDQQLSYKEAAAVSSIGATFKGTDIMAFRELRFFSSLVTIEDGAFYGCEKLIAITLPDAVETIGKEAFRNCYTLSEIDIPDGVKSLDERVFQNCTQLEEVVIPASVERIPYYCFYGCEKLTDIVIEEGVRVIGERAFQSCYALKEVVVPTSVTEIERNAFYFCKALERVTLSEGLTTISNETFYNCESLKSITLPSALTSIGNYAFRNCEALAEVVTNDKLEQIGDYAFKNCTSLTQIMIPATVTSIGGWSFEDCTSLVSVWCEPIEPPLLGTDAFDYNGTDRKIFVPEESVESYKAAKVWSDYVLSIEAQPVE